MPNTHTTAITALHLLTDNTETLRRLACQLIAHKVDAGEAVEIPNCTSFRRRTSTDEIRSELVFREVPEPALREVAAQLIAERWVNGESFEAKLSPGFSILMKPERVQE